MAVSLDLSSPAVSFLRGGRVVLGADRGMGVWLFAQHRLGWSPVPAAFVDVHDGEREKLGGGKGSRRSTSTTPSSRTASLRPPRWLLRWWGCCGWTAAMISRRSPD